MIYLYVIDNLNGVFFSEFESHKLFLQLERRYGILRPCSLLLSRGIRMVRTGPKKQEIQLRFGF